MRTKALLMTLAIVVFAVAACGGSEGGDPTGRTWQLVELEGSAPLEGTAIDLTITDGTASGSSGCNNYNGSAEVGDGTMTLGPDFATTMMACEPPIMDQEQAYVDALTRVTAFEMSDDTLTLLDGDGEVLATFE